MTSCQFYLRTCPLVSSSIKGSRGTIPNTCKGQILVFLELDLQIRNLKTTKALSKASASLASSSTTCLKIGAYHDSDFTSIRSLNPGPLLSFGPVTTFAKSQLICEAPIPAVRLRGAKARLCPASKVK